MVVMVREKILNLSHQQVFSRLDKHWHTVKTKCENC
jgi:hypothetical protein